MFISGVRDELHECEKERAQGATLADTTMALRKTCNVRLVLHDRIRINNSCLARKSDGHGVDSIHHNEPSIEQNAVEIEIAAHTSERLTMQR